MFDIILIDALIVLMGTIEALIGRKEDTTIKAIKDIRITIDPMCILFVKILDGEAKGVGN